jgi:hypothetical protein
VWVRIPPRVLSALDEIDALVGIGRRTPGSDAERRAARHLEARLKRLGGPAEVEPLDVRPRWALTSALSVALSVLGSFGAQPVVAGQFAVLACCLALVADVEAIALGVVQFVPTVLLVVAVALLLTWPCPQLAPARTTTDRGSCWR